MTFSTISMSSTLSDQRGHAVQLQRLAYTLTATHMYTCGLHLITNPEGGIPERCMIRKPLLNIQLMGRPSSSQLCIGSIQTSKTVVDQILPDMPRVKPYCVGLISSRTPAKLYMIYSARSTSSWHSDQLLTTSTSRQDVNHSCDLQVNNAWLR